MAEKRALTEDGCKADVPDYCQVLRFKDSSGQVKEMLFPKALDLHRPKRPRTTFSEDQLAILETEFQKSPYLVGSERGRLARELGLSETQIKVWFQNRRTKQKRETEGPPPGDSESEQAGAVQPSELKLLFPFSPLQFPRWPIN